MSQVTKKVYNYYERRQSIPIIYCRGTHYDVGYDVVSTNILFDNRKGLEKQHKVDSDEKKPMRLHGRLCCTTKK